MHQVLGQMIERHAELAACVPDVERAFRVLRECFRSGGKLLICGNGGSAADADHIAAELMKGMASRRPLEGADREGFVTAIDDLAAQLHLAATLQGALPAVSLAGNAALLTAVANDMSPDLVFAQQVWGLGRPGDAVLALSTSGTSANVLHALRVARTLELATVGLTGQGGEMAPLCDALIRAPGEDTVAVQERHLPVYHALCLMLEREFFG